VAKVIPKAKGKIKRQALAEEEEYVQEYFEKEAKKVRKSAEPQVAKAEITTKEVLNILADEVEEIYERQGYKINRVNSLEKARIIYLEIRYKMGTSVKEKEFDLPLCKEHTP
jgi:hypothetical protein